MREGWSYKKLGEVCEIERGGSPRPIQQYITDDEDGLNWIKIGDAVDGSKYINSTKEKIIKEGLKKTRFVHKGDFILSNSMSFGKPYILGIDGCIHDGWLVIRDINNLFDKSFLYYLLGSPNMYNEFKRLAVGGVVNNLNSQLVRNVSVAIPPLSEQQRIVSELDLLSGIIEKKKAQLKEYDQLVQSIFYDMFGDPMANEKGWEVKKLGEVASFKNGLNYHPKDDGYQIKCIGVGDFQNKKEIRDFSSINDYSIDEDVDDSYYLKDGDIIIVRSNGSKDLVGRNMIVYPNCQKVTYSGFCIRCRLNSSTILPIILNRILSDRGTMMVLRQEGRGCNISNINQKILSSLPIILPPLSLQQSFAEKIEAIEHQKALIQQSIAETETLFNSRMDYYFN